MQLNGLFSARLDLFLNVGESQAMEIVQQLGPVPRLFESEFRNTYTQDLTPAINNLSMQEITALLSNTSSLGRSDVSHKIVMISRSSRENLASNTKVSIISNSVSTTLGLRLRYLQASQQVELYQQLSSNPLTAAAAGCVYEANILRQLSNGLTLRLVPIIKPSSPSSDDPNPRQPRWRSPHNSSLLSPLLLDAQAAAQDAAVQLDLSPATVEQFKGTSKLSVSPQTLYIPSVSNQPAQDAFFVLDNIIYFFQMTIAAQHDINKKLVHFATELGFEAKDCRFILFTPKGSPLLVRCPSDSTLRAMDVFVAELNARVV